MPTAKRKTATSKSKRQAAAKATPAKKARAAHPKDTCFTIMPFGGWFDDYYDSIYKPALEAAGLRPKRADDLYRPSTIVNDIWSYTKGAKLVLADLTGKNPNVFYELGLAHALAKPVVLVAESMNDVPFDLRALRVIEYDKNEPRWGDTLRDKIIQSVGEVLASPIASVLPAFIETKPQPEAKPISEQEKALLELRQEIDLLRREIRVNESRILESRESRQLRPEASRLISPEEATELVKKYVDLDMPDSLIIRRLVVRGAPESWVKDEIKRSKAPKTSARKAKK